MKKTVFIDRDGVINSDVGHYYIYKPEDVVINDGVYEACRLLQDRGYELVLITNQGGIARGTYHKTDVEMVHAEILKAFAAHGIKVLEVYYCPHHDKVEKCLCRKPGNINIEKAIARFHIDRKNSWMIGDSERDILAGKASGLRTIKVDSNENILPYCQQLIEE